MREWCGLEVRHSEIDLAIRSIVDWYNADTPGAIILAGNYGCGKTSLARVVYQFSGGPVMLTDWTGRGPVQFLNALFLSEPNLLEDIRKSYSSGGESGVIGRCQKARLLILDDLGAAYVKDDSRAWYEDIMWRLFDGRGDKKTLITTNLNPIELKSRLGGRCWSRLQEMLVRSSNVVSMFGVPDYRARNF